VQRLHVVDLPMLCLSLLRPRSAGLDHGAHLCLIAPMNADADGNGGGAAGDAMIQEHPDGDGGWIGGCAARSPKLGNHSASLRFWGEMVRKTTNLRPSA